MYSCLLQLKGYQITEGIVTIVSVTVFLVAILISLVLLARKNYLLYERDRSLLVAQFNEQLLKSQLEVQEQTQNRIAEELHDNIGALASLLKINLTLMPQSTPTQQTVLLQESRKVLRDMIQEIKLLSVSMNSYHLSELGLTALLAADVERLQKLQQFEIHFTECDIDLPLETDTKIILYRICQELLNNIIKHANAKHIAIAMHCTTNYLTITIRDDGKGFLPATDKRKLSSGLVNMHNRIKLINGLLNIQSELGKGTLATITLPILLTSNNHE